MNDPILLLYPLINLVVTGVFAGMVLSQYMQRHRLYQLYWSIALSMAFLATLAYVLMIIVQPTTDLGAFLFRLYYILGAALMPAWLGLGSIALVSSARITRISLIVLSVLSGITIVLVALAGIDVNKLSHVVGTAGANVLQPGVWLVMLITLNTLGVIAVVSVAAYSGWKVQRRQATVAGMGASTLLWANVLILVGDILNALAGSSARLGIGNLFWLIMSFGWTVFFVGTVLASAHRRVQVPASTSTEAPKTLPV